MGKEIISTAICTIHYKVCIAENVDDNVLRYDTTSINPNLTEGIVVGYTRGNDEVVFRNDGYGLERAYIGEGISAAVVSGEAPSKGLWFLCNDNFVNDWNFWSRKVSNAPFAEQNFHTIRTNQGQQNRPADNTFDQWPVDSAKWDFVVTTIYNPIIYWHRNTGNFFPVSYTTTGLFPAVVTSIPQNNCASKTIVILPDSMGTTGPVKAYLQDEKLAYGNTRHLYEQLLDGGQTDEVLQEIQESWPQDAWDLRAALLARSPFLSDTVLKEVVMRNILPEAMLAEVLVANPKATRESGFTRWLQYESGHPLPEYLLGMVVASWDQRGYRDALEDEMGLHHAEMSAAATMLIERYNSDTLGSLTDSLRWVWQQVRTPGANTRCPVC